MKTTDFDYFLPPDHIAQDPLEPRHDSRLLVFRRDSKKISHTSFWHIGDYLRAGDILVINQTRVMPARIIARKDTGGRVELLLLRKEDGVTWEVLVGGSRMRVGRKVIIDNGPGAEIIAELDGPRRLVRFDEPVETCLGTVGQMPLPPYIHKALEDPERYQTVYATDTGSAAAPTAGLHFTPELIQHLKEQGIGFVGATLHVGLDTFAPVTEENPEQHKIHTEWCELTKQAAQEIHQKQRAGGRIIAVGTTSVRTLESAARFAGPGSVVGPFCGPTDLYILPGYDFRVVDSLVTNFHLPRSTLLMLVSAFAGRRQVLDLYRAAMDSGYRFYSFGDAMLIL